MCVLKERGLKVEIGTDSKMSLSRMNHEMNEGSALTNICLLLMVMEA